jgi:hypothetical protein
MLVDFRFLWCCHGPGILKYACRQLAANRNDNCVYRPGFSALGELLGIWQIARFDFGVRWRYVLDGGKRCGRQ